VCSSPSDAAGAALVFVASLGVTGWQVHGMGRESVPADWPPLTATEVDGVLGAFPAVSGRAGRIVWRSPRPFSAAAVVALESPAPGHTEGDEVFVKRHHRDVRQVLDLEAEHAFADHLGAGGIPVPEVLRTDGGDGGWERDGWTYEVSRVGRGWDRYREVPSWMPYTSVADAAAAGVGLAGLHLAAADFALPARPAGVLRSGDRVDASTDPVAAVAGLAADRPRLAAYLEARVGFGGRAWAEELEEALGSLAIGPFGSADGPDRPTDQWGHGDWHPSNLLWSDADADAPVRVTSVLDLGLADRTSVPFDLAVGLERATVTWVDLAGGGRPRVDLACAVALLSGYQAVRPLTPGERAALVAVLPVAHLDFALSEVEYFAGVLGRRDLADLAWAGYALGHLVWWRSRDGRAYLDALRGELLRVP
jgi:Ser/Thr protein kinase RdoA (MazF antagonist)